MSSKYFIHNVWQKTIFHNLQFLHKLIIQLIFFLFLPNKFFSRSPVLEKVHIASTRSIFELDVCIYSFWDFLKKIWQAKSVIDIFKLSCCHFPYIFELRLRHVVDSIFDFIPQVCSDVDDVWRCFPASVLSENSGQVWS